MQHHNMNLCFNIVQNMTFSKAAFCQVINKDFAITSVTVHYRYWLCAK